MTTCVHKWKWVRDWIGDINVVNGTQDCSRWICRECDAEDNSGKNDEPDPYRDHVEAEEDEMELLHKAALNMGQP